MDHIDYLAAEQSAQLKRRLDSIEKRLSPWMKENGIAISHHDDYAISLGVNLNWEASGYRGNIAIVFRHTPRRFDVGVIKTHDVDRRRYYKREKLYDEVSIEEIEKNLIEIMDRALAKWQSWSESGLSDYLDMPPLHSSRVTRE
jgi:hypothetical protein